MSFFFTILYQLTIFPVRHTSEAQAYCPARDSQHISPRFIRRKMPKHHSSLQSQKQFDVKSRQVSPFGFYVIIWFNIVTHHFLQLSKHCSQLVLQVTNQLLHELVNLLIVQCGVLILKHEAYSIALLASFQVLSFVHVEQFYRLE